MNHSFVSRFVEGTITAILIFGICQGQALAQAPDPSKTIPTTEPVTKEQREAFEKIIREYLLKNPSVIREAILALQAQEEKEKRERSASGMKVMKSDIYSDPDSPVAGNPNGDVTIVVFFDYNCGYCKKSLPELQTLLAKDHAIRVIYKEFPILGRQSVAAAQAALAANRQGKYFEFQRALFGSDGAGGDRVKSISDRLGLDYETLKKDMADPKLIEALERTRRLADALAIDGTPAYIVGSQLIPGAIEIESLSRLVSSERAKLSNSKTVKEGAEPPK